MKTKMLIVAMMISLILPVMGFATVPTPPQTTSNSQSGAEDIAFSGTQYLQPQPHYPYLMQLIPGVVGDVTDRPEMPDFANIMPLKKGEQVLNVEAYTRGGRIAGFSRLEDFDTDLLKLIPTVQKKFGQKDCTKIRYKVLFKMSVKTIGSGGGGGGSTSGFSGGTNPVAWGSNASIMPGFAVNTSDPKFILKFFLIK